MDVELTANDFTKIKVNDQLLLIIYLLICCSFADMKFEGLAAIFFPFVVLLLTNSVTSKSQVSPVFLKLDSENYQSPLSGQLESLYDSYVVPFPKFNPYNQLFHLPNAEHHEVAPSEDSADFSADQLGSEDVSELPMDGSFNAKLLGIVASSAVKATNKAALLDLSKRISDLEQSNKMQSQDLLSLQLNEVILNTDIANLRQEIANLS